MLDILLDNACYTGLRRLEECGHSGSGARKRLARTTGVKNFKEGSGWSETINTPPFGLS